jgi:hypothetical protein
MEAKLESIRRLIGRIHNLVKAGTQDPILFVRKVSDKEIARFIADTGKTVRTGQDLIYIDAKVQMIELMTQYSPEKRIECGRAAMALLSGERPEVQDAAEPETETVRTATEQFTVVEKEERPEPSERDRLFSQVIVLQDRLKTYGDATFQAFRETHKIYRSEDKTSNADLTAYIEAITAEVANLELPPAEPRTSEIADVAWEDEVGLDDVPGRIPEEDDIPL